MEDIKLLLLLLSLLTAIIPCFAQPEYTEVKNRYCSNAEAHRRDLQKKDDLTFLLTPLTELKLNERYVLSDFRRYRTLRHREWSQLRLYVRKKTQNRPEEEYFEKEYSRYLKCKKDKVPYKTNKDQVAFVDPFKKISLTGTQMSIWQAYLLYQSSCLFGMRDEGNYSQTHLITSAEDVDSVISFIKNSWDEDLFREDFDINLVKKDYIRHTNETFAVVDSLQNIKTQNLEPVFTYAADSVTIEHYAFGEFHGLVKFKTTMYFANRHHRHVKRFNSTPAAVLAKYRRNIWY